MGWDRDEISVGGYNDITFYRVQIVHSPYFDIYQV